MIRLHARRDPRHPALVDARRSLAYGELDTLMDRIAATLQRDGVGPQQRIAVCASASVEYAAVFLGALRAGVVVAPLAPGETAKSLAGMLADSGAKLLFVDAGTAPSFPGTTAPDVPRIGLDGSSAGRPFEDWLAPAGTVPAPVAPGPDWAVQHHLFLRHHGHAQGHRAAARDALDAGATRRRQLRLRARHGHPGLDAALFEHHARGLLADDGLGRLRGAHAEVRHPRVPAPRAAAPGHARDAGAGAVPAADGAPGVRRVRPFGFPDEVLHQRAVRRGAQGRRAGALAGRAGRVLRHDRRRRQLRPAGARASGQAAHRRPADGGPRHPPDRRRRPRGRAGRDRRGRRPLGLDDARLSRPAGEDARGRVVRARPASASSAPATSAASTPKAS